MNLSLIVGELDRIEEEKGVEFDLELPDFETVKCLEDYIIWLQVTVRVDLPGKWPHPQQVRYNYHILVIALARYCGWLDD